MRTHFLSIIALAFLAVGISTGSRTALAAETVHLFVGEVQGTDAFVAIASDGTRLTAYICDGRPEGVFLWGWFDGELTLNASTELVATNGVVLQLAAVINHEEQFTGTVRLRDGTTAPFTTEAASGEAALWRYQGVVNGSAILAGWIVLSDGRQRGAMIKDGTSNTIAAIGDGSVRLDGVILTPSRIDVSQQTTR